MAWLESFNPLWDFLTAVGTVSAVAVSLWLATRKPKTHLALFVELRGASFVLTITNDGEAEVTVRRCDWRAKCMTGAGRLELPQYPFQYNGQPAQSIPRRVINGDILETWVSVKAIAEQANSVIPETATMEQIDHDIRKSCFVCVTTTGIDFSANLPVGMQDELIKQFRLLRTPLP